MFMVVMSFADDLFVEADDYEVDEDSDLVFLAEADEDHECDDNGMMEVARVRAGRWDAVVEADVDDEDEEVE